MKAKWTTALMIAMFSGALAIGTAASAEGMSSGMNSGTSSEMKSETSFKKLDQNGDGQISQQEAATNPTLAKHFKRLDSNNDGTLERAELARFETMEQQGTQMKNNMQRDNTWEQGQGNSW